MFSSSCSWFRLSADWLDELELPLLYAEYPYVEMTRFADFAIGLSSADA
jgi:hypothetical protein